MAVPESSIIRALTDTVAHLVERRSSVIMAESLAADPTPEQVRNLDVAAAVEQAKGDVAKILEDLAKILRQEPEAANDAPRSQPS